MARRKKGDGKKVSIVWILILTMIFGTLAAAFLFSEPRPAETPPPTPEPTVQPGEETITLRHIRFLESILTQAGFQTVTYVDRFVFVVLYIPLGNRSVTFV
ncbi:MAG: hypothetical protein HY555_06180, partial [Euryarchaeota archaeon]|nr:hypothetical protein [Euryarchaeota archaeon]